MFHPDVLSYLVLLLLPNLQQKKNISHYIILHNITPQPSVFAFSLHIVWFPFSIQFLFNFIIISRNICTEMRPLVCFPMRYIFLKFMVHRVKAFTAIINWKMFFFVVVLSLGILLSTEGKRLKVWVGRPTYIEHCFGTEI